MIYTIKRLFGCLLFFSSHLSIAQFTDHFSDGDFTNNPTWTGSANFIINGSSQLQLNNSVASTSALSSAFAAPSLDNFEWQVYVKQTFAPSATNFGRVYLVSDQSNLTGPLNGYYLKFGEALALDAVELFKQSGMISTSVCRATNGAIANSANLRVRVLRSNTGVWKLMIDYAGGTNFVLEASATDATFNSSSFLGVVCVYTVGNANKFFYDDFYMGPEIVDTSPPSIESVNALSPTQLDVIFNENLDPTSSQLLTNYSVNNGIGNPTSAVLQTGDKTVRLTFAHPFPNALTCQLTVSGIQDLFNNSIAVVNQNFFFFHPVPAEPRDILIMEIFADPSPSVGLPEFEFLEVYNRSNKIFDLQNWKITDGSSTGTLPARLFFPGEYIILTTTSSAPQLSSYGTVLGVTNFPTLNNSSDNLVLKDNTDLQIDHVFYSDTWYHDEDKKQGGYSLERIDPDNVCAEENNWKASEAGSGGTPGTQNSVLTNNADQAGPKLISVIPTSATELIIEFNEKLQGQLPATTNFTINPSTGVSQIAFADGSLKKIQLTLIANLEFGITYSITAQNIFDCPGNSIDSNSNTFVFGLPEQANRLDIAISEILFNPSPAIGLPESEYVEIYNRSNKIVDLRDWIITDGSSSGTLPTHLFFPNQYIILTSASAVTQFTSFGTVLGVMNFPALNNSGEVLILKDSADSEINRVSFTDDWYRDDEKKDGGFSLELIDPANLCAEESNWKASEATSGGTPGIQNSVYANMPDLTGPQLVSAIPTSKTEMIIQFNEKLSDQLPAFTDFIISPTIPVLQIAFADGSLKTFHLTLSDSLQSGITYTIAAQNIYDCPGNAVNSEANTFVFGLPEEPDSLDIVINEILFNPRPTGIDFVEVYNNSQKYFNLKNWSIANYENGELLNIQSITAEDFLLPPHQYIVFTENNQVVKGEYVQAVEEKLFLVENLPGFSDGAGTVALVDPQQSVIDFLEYSDKDHSVFIDDDEGVSLERISFIYPTNDKANWKSASSTAGFATPGFVNSNVRGESISGEIMINPEIFEPITGQPSFTQIHYNFEQGGSVANVKILDYHGREIRQIANNATLGTDGFFRWDGDNNDGTKARTGYYVVWIEVFNADGSLNTFRKRVVVTSTAK